MSDYAPTPVEDFLDPDHPTLFPRLTPEQIETVVGAFADRKDVKFSGSGKLMIKTKGVASGTNFCAA